MSRIFFGVVGADAHLYKSASSHYKLEESSYRALVVAVPHMEEEVRLLAAVVEVVKVEAEGGPSHMGRLFDHPDPVVAVAAPVGCRDSRGSLAGCSRRVPISAFHPRSSQSGMSALQLAQLAAHPT
jgi:hypothetical protein